MSTRYEVETRRRSLDGTWGPWIGGLEAQRTLKAARKAKHDYVHRCYYDQARIVKITRKIVK